MVLLDRRQRRQRQHHACHRDDQLLQHQPDVHLLFDSGQPLFGTDSRPYQPGGTWTTFPNTTTYSVQYLNGMLVTAMASGTAADGYTYPKGLYYEVNVSSGTPVLVTQGVIDPGPGVSVQMPSVAIDSKGNLGFTWMEASSTRVRLDVGRQPRHHGPLQRR